mmetsp:Transcript_3961/g.10174  ORF Transcript_3961/g.10174 Transcript_3961/m.10174 type:complete len:301 (-) Transcript_3961:328-1230(-)
MGYKGISKDREWSEIAYRICVGVVLKFMLGSDDLVWLSPFMARARSVQQKVDIAIKYVLSVLFLTLLACALAVLIHTAATTSNSDEIVDECIATVAAFLLFAYAQHMAYEEGYFNACIKPDASTTPADSAEVAEEVKSPLKKEDVDAEAVAEYGTMRPPPEDEAVDEAEDLGPFKKAVKDSLLAISDTFDSYCSCVDADTRELSKDLDDDGDQGVVIVAFLGSMDDFMVYFTLALSHELTWFELAAGVTIGGVLIALLVGLLLQASERLANAVESIPVPFILTGLSIFILISAWTSFDGF